jgi:hypothetical protein
MTLTRKLALKLLDSVVRHASPGRKDWAEGLAREATFIESDWTALAWALGSTRVLLSYREAPIGSLAEVPAAAQKFVEATRISALGMWVPILQGPLYLWQFFEARSGLERAGCALVVLCSVSAAIFMSVERRRLKDPSTDNIYDEIVACALFYKAELERRYSTLILATWVVLGYCVGAMLAIRGGVRGHAIFSMAIVLLILLVMAFFVHARRTIRRQIEQLDDLLAQTP